MVKFAHMGDVHLGGWKQQEMRDLNFHSFQKAIQVCIKEKVDFILIAGDLFDNAFPPIEILKKTFAEFRKIHDAGIKCFFIAGSHDYSVSGKTFLDVLENTGFCKNVENVEIIGDESILNPTLHMDIAIYGYRGKKTSLEINELKKMKLKETEGFKILMLHTTIDKALGNFGNLPIEAINTEELPHADYYALGHLHIDFQYGNFVYPGPVFPNNFAELEKLKGGSFYIVETNKKDYTRKKIELKEKDVEQIRFNVKSAVTATEEAIFELSQKDLRDKIVLLRFSGELEDSKISNINFKLIEDFVMKKGAYFVLRNTHELKEKEEAIEINVGSENIGEETTRLFLEKSESKFKQFAEGLIHSLSAEKREGETSDDFFRRIFDESKKILKF